jgi:ubiquinone/menaquinone biosynthesis C-methylase UbiE
VALEYIHRCHLRVGRHIPRQGRFLLDAGSGPIQYPEYLEYSHQFKRRVCLDISIVALREARNRIKDHGLYVVADIARLPFKSNCFDGLVSLHTVHHLPTQEHVVAYQEFFRVLSSGSSAVIVNGGPHLCSLANVLIRMWNGICPAEGQTRPPGRN